MESLQLVALRTKVPLFSSIDEYELMTIADAMKDIRRAFRFSELESSQVQLLEEEGTTVIKQAVIVL